MICISCKNEHQGNFCPNCGERAGVPKITFKSMFAEAFSTVTNMDKGFLLNLKYLTLDPRQLIISYLQGKRKGIYNPISFLILSVTIYLIIDSFIDIPSEIVSTKNNNSGEYSIIYKVGYEAGWFVETNLKYFWLLSIFWLGIATKIMFGKYNFAEHLTVSSFAIGYATLFGLIGLLMFKWDSLVYNPSIYIAIIWILYQVFKKENDKVGTFIQAIISVMLFILQIVLITVGIGIIRNYST